MPRKRAATQESNDDQPQSPAEAPELPLSYDLGLVASIAARYETDQPEEAAKKAVSLIIACEEALKLLAFRRQPVVREFDDEGKELAKFVSRITDIPLPKDRNELAEIVNRIPGFLQRPAYPSSEAAMRFITGQKRTDRALRLMEQFLTQNHREMQAWNLAVEAAPANDQEYPVPLDWEEYLPQVPVVSSDILIEEFRSHTPNFYAVQAFRSDFVEWYKGHKSATAQAKGRMPKIRQRQKRMPKRKSK